MKIPSRMIALATVVPLAVSLPFFGYTWNLLMHILGAVLFVGNLAVTAVWMSLARRDGKPDTIRFASRGIVLADVIFSIPGAVLLVANGGIVGAEFFKAGASWLIAALALFVVTAVVWLAALVPLQKRLADVAGLAGDEIPGEWHELNRRWFRWGGVATLLPIVILALMVAKPNLW